MRSRSLHEGWIRACDGGVRYLIIFEKGSLKGSFRKSNLGGVRCFIIFEKGSLKGSFGKY